MPVQSERAAARNPAHRSGRRRGDSLPPQPALSRRRWSGSETNSSAREQLAGASSRTPGPGDDSAKADPGIAALIIFTAAVLVIVAAVVVAGAVNRWWILAPVMLVDFTVVFGVIATINHLLADDGDL